MWLKVRTRGNDQRQVSRTPVPTILWLSTSLDLSFGLCFKRYNVSQELKLVYIKVSGVSVRMPSLPSL